MEIEETLKNQIDGLGISNLAINLKFKPKSPKLKLGITQIERNVKDFILLFQSNYEKTLWNTWLYLGIFTSKLTIERIDNNPKYNRHPITEIHIQFQYNGLMNQIKNDINLLINSKWDKIIGLKLDNFSIELLNKI